MGRWHAAYAGRLGARVGAVVDRSPEAASRLAQLIGGAHTFTDLDSMLAENCPQVVHLCTPLDSHYALALRALDSGVHVLVEKPLVPTVDETDSLLVKARDTGLQICPVHQFAFQRGVETAAEALEGMGEALLAHFTICSAGGAGQAGGALDAIVADILPHPLSVLQKLWPRQSLQAGDWTARRHRPGEWQVVGRAGGTTVSLSLSMNARPTRCELDVLCTGGSVYLNFFHGYSVARPGITSRAEKITQPFRHAAASFAAAGTNLACRVWRREPAYPGLGKLLGRFYDSARGTGPSPFEGHEILAVAQVRDRVMQQIMADIPG